MASKRTPRLSHQVPLRIRVQSLESSGDILSGSCWPNIQNQNSYLLVLVSLSDSHDVFECIPTKNKEFINIYHVSYIYIDSQKREKQLSTIYKLLDH